jgi:predicted nucleic acid-binding protein
VAVKYLVDTNIFLEILLGQTNKELCKQFLQGNAGQCGLSDFSLHSIGVITFRGRREQAYRAFLQDALPGLALLHLEKHRYLAMLQAHQQHGLDFDDAYQFVIAQSHGLTLITQDRDFDRVKQAISVRFI